MRNIGGTSKYVAFLDECGDHSLSKLDPDFPLFVLAAIVIARVDYTRVVIPALGALKLKYWNHEGVNLHSREIRKALGSFSFLQVAEIRVDFLKRITTFIKDMPFTLFVTAIRKDLHQQRYGVTAKSPYDLALELSLERIQHFLAGEGETELPCVAEARGKKEDEALERVFYRVMTMGTFYQSAKSFRELTCPLVFRSKQDNIAGIQIADLCAHPCARHILRPDQKNQAYDIAQAHLYSRGGVSGWKVFP